MWAATALLPPISFGIMRKFCCHCFLFFFRTQLCLQFSRISLSSSQSANYLHKSLFLSTWLKYIWKKITNCCLGREVYEPQKNLCVQILISHLGPVLFTVFLFSLVFLRKCRIEFARQFLCIFQITFQQLQTKWKVFGIVMFKTGSICVVFR